MGLPLSLLLLLACLAGLTPLAIDMYLPSLPTIAHDLGVPVAQAQLTISVFLAGFALGQLFYGPLADAVGRKPVMLGGLILFTLASLGCATADSIEALMAFRLLQAVGGAAGSVVLNALLKDMFERDMFAKVMSMVILVMTLAPLLAPLIGGYLLLIAHWHSIFILLAAIGLLVTIMLAIRIPETLKPELRQPFRLLPVLHNYGKILRHRAALGYILCGALTTAAMFAFISGSPLVYIELFQVPAQHYGLLFGMNILLMMVLTFANSRLVKTLGSDRLLKLGLSLAALAALALIVNAVTGIGGLWGIVLPVMLLIAQISLIGANSMAGLLNHFPEVAGTAAALAGTTRFGLGAIATFAVNASHVTSALPMALVMTLCAWLALGCYWLLVHPALAKSVPIQH
ncbi:DHA1 family bicyclomycin/chloramphenicol resistance-like MFS transporter [Oceanisphaera litoralis]|uniref:Bcr/CflA family multidrug efflux MFS transporter n=1 Tax=Oceanisphaera litoralis TaxID=225144 RepID=UPI001958F1DB|nr:Bcr/CflA family multidrug efflux MFS transporter [Oceanisphaera litoralis]MBM7457167.1 DHA1 family bicyclomycin/chloramphenicol resistance-like MFS transporter [Oceanisphaera litoralis]